MVEIKMWSDCFSPFVFVSACYCFTVDTQGLGQLFPSAPGLCVDGFENLRSRPIQIFELVPRERPERRRLLQQVPQTKSRAANAEMIAIPQAAHRNAFCKQHRHTFNISGTGETTETVLSLVENPDLLGC